MTAIAELTAPDTLKLPAQIMAQFRPSDRFVVWVEGDTVYLKRITPASIVEIVDEAPTGEALSLAEINELVHQARRKQQGE